MHRGAWPQIAAAALLALAGVLQVGEAVRADEVPFNSKFEVNAGGKAFEGTDGYLTLGGLAGLPLDRDYENGMAFVDLEGHQLLEGDRAYNASLGYRWADWSNGTVWGVNAGVSGRSKDGDWYRWCNFGVERLAPDFDLRANGYLLCGEGQQNVRCEAVGFESNSLLVANRADLGLQGFDLSIGADDSSLLGQPLFDGSDLYGKLEFYYFFGAFDGDAVGGRAQLDWQVSDNIALNGWVSYDTLFETSGLVGVTVSFGGPAQRSDRQDGLGTGERLVSFIERRTLMAIHEDAFDKGSTGPLKDGSGDAIPFWHVDNTAPAGGNGTYEHPFDTLADAGAEAGTTGPGDVIIFHVGDGTTNQQQDGITLQDRQYLIGGSFDRSFRLGGKDILLGEFFQEEGRPVMTDSDGDALRLANGNYTAGFDIRNAAGNGVHGSAINGLTMIDVGIYDSVGSGIAIEGGSGDFLFRALQVVGNDGLLAAPDDDGGGGFNLLAMTGTVTLEDSNCEASGLFGGDESVYDCLEVRSAATGDLAVAIRRSSFINNWGNGIETHVAGSGRFDLTIEDTLVADNTESAIALQSDFQTSGDFGAALRRLTIDSNGWAGIELAHLAGGGDFAVLVEDSQIIDNSTRSNFDPLRQSGIGLTSRGGLTELVLRGNIISGHAAAGVDVEATPQQEGGTLIRAYLADNVITGNGFGRTDDYTGGVILWASSTDVDLDSNPVMDGTGRIEATLLRNVLDSNNANGLFAVPVRGYVGFPEWPSATLCVDIRQNSGGDRLFLDNGSNFTYSFPPDFEQIAGGNFFQDPASGGNANPVVTSGAIGSRNCETPAGS